MPLHSCFQPASLTHPPLAPTGEIREMPQWVNASLFLALWAVLVKKLNILMAAICDMALEVVVFCGHVLFQFLCNLQQYCDSAYNKINNHQQKEFINITKMNYIGGKNRREREGDKHTRMHAHTHQSHIRAIRLKKSFWKEKGFQGRFKKDDRGRKSDRNWELVPDNWSLVKERA